ncbi:glycine betaine ABC transporter substrate-binding protein [Gordonia zhaorongruii]|uniref:glycine betaine ABC transporter substrate-binding protein n=1 Tax=Gordonia zhaorongruii TaxID=2597659 RepID=UPI001405287D|nr:glycine betaine ABC transporter substrate-binding protein [Gordonia zhaorongruii]
MRTQRRTLAALVAAVLAAVALTACGGADDPVVRVGHDGTPEMRTAAAIYAGALARTGLKVHTLDAAPDGDQLIDDVASGDVGVYPAYTGDLLRQLTPAPKALTPEDVLADVNRSLPQQVSIGDPSLVSDRWQILAGQGLIEHSGIEDLAECGRFPGGLPLLTTQAPPQEALGAAKACRYGAVEQVDSREELVQRVRDGHALGLITALDAASVPDLTDVQALPSKGAPIAQALVPVFRSGLMAKPQLKALSRVAGELTTADLAQLVREVREGGDPHVVAGRWLGTSGV